MLKKATNASIVLLLVSLAVFAQPSIDTDGDSLRADLARIVGLENEKRAETFLRIFRERGLEPEIGEFQNPARFRNSPAVGRNLIVTLGEGDRDIVVGAHYDAIRMRDGDISDGAVDNGASSVVLTRVAESLRQHALKHRIRVVLFDLEEIGLIGSRAYVQSEDASRIAAMVNVDVIAGDGVIMFGPTSHEGNEVVYRSLRLVCAVKAISCMDFPEYPMSDYRPFQAAGIPNVSLAMIEAASSHEFWLFLNALGQSGLRRDFVPDLLRVIHTPDDTIERVDTTAMTRVHDAVVALVVELDGAL
ncbi:MAG: M28 family peptidase [Gammaproteobacteria bacterium]|nr:M28 family peptidase [Gammaproteobacteria bacterium]